MKKLKNDQGFSLIELLMVAVILGLVMTAVYSLYLNSQKNAYQSEEIVDAQQNLRIAMDTMITDIRMSGFLTSSSLNAVTSAPASLAGGATLTLSAPVSSGIYSRSVGDVTVANGATGVVTVDSLMGASFIQADPVVTFVLPQSELEKQPC
ncbi:prepilin-type N-terminal cleavage/methylation domain-containing protein [uncultured Desulfuromonas sp.]|uniref:PilW family protein n=1 Tax=uncultured Desulfuromonas sp. TaxID=181013 RepID=UPI002AAB6552|nr:prepilin-type N-terminal cleavage/methylation domain-containing protein [uncultured Desulfuromonas sp.]